VFESLDHSVNNAQRDDTRTASAPAAGSTHRSNALILTFDQPKVLQLEKDVFS